MKHGPRANVTRKKKVDYAPVSSGSRKRWLALVYSLTLYVPNVAINLIIGFSCAVAIPPAVLLLCLYELRMEMFTLAMTLWFAVDLSVTVSRSRKYPWTVELVIRPLLQSEIWPEY